MAATRSACSGATLWPVKGPQWCWQIERDLRFVDKAGTEIKPDQDGVFRRWGIVDHIRCRYPPSKAASETRSPFNCAEAQPARDRRLWSIPTERDGIECRLASTSLA